MYEVDVNAEAIFEVCKTHIPVLGKMIAKMMDDVTRLSEGE